MKNRTNFFELESEKYWSFPASQREESREEIRRMILSGDYLGSRKMDGNYFRFVKDMDGTMSLQSRSRGVNGSFANKLESVPHLRRFFDALPCGTCLLGELYLPENETASAVTTLIGGKTERAVKMQQDERNRLHYYVFDVWQWNGVSQLETKAAKRFSLLDTLRPYETEYVSFAQYFTGQRLLDELNNVLSAGGEGIVLTRKDSTPDPGKRTARKTVKVKREMANTLDVVIMGANPPAKEYAGKLPESWPFWEDGIPVTRNYALRLPGSLQIGVTRDGEVVQIGSLGGLTDDIMSSWQEYVGRVCEISCMEIHETGGLRHPRFLRWRNDLTANDCEYSKIYPDTNRTVSEELTALRQRAEQAEKRLAAALEEIARLNAALAKERTAVSHKIPDTDNKPKDKATALLERLSALDGITAIIKGAKSATPVVWLSGDTDTHKTEIENMGGRWSGKRGAWYFKVA